MATAALTRLSPAPALGIVGELLLAAPTPVDLILLKAGPNNKGVDLLGRRPPGSHTVPSQPADSHSGGSSPPPVRIDAGCPTLLLPPEIHRGESIRGWTCHCGNMPIGNPPCPSEPLHPRLRLTLARLHPASMAPSVRWHRSIRARRPKCTPPTLCTPFLPQRTLVPRDHLGALVRKPHASRVPALRVVARRPALHPLPACPQSAGKLCPSCALQHWLGFDHTHLSPQGPPDRLSPRALGSFGVICFFRPLELSAAHAFCLSLPPSLPQSESSTPQAPRDSATLIASKISVLIQDELALATICNHHIFHALCKVSTVEHVSCPIPTLCPAASALRALVALIAFDCAHAAIGANSHDRAANKVFLGLVHVLVLLIHDDAPPPDSLVTPLHHAPQSHLSQALQLSCALPTSNLPLRTPSALAITTLYLGAALSIHTPHALSNPTKFV
ncbi:hypothetical protein B0H10DRAFT_2208548 [Mycena sp. CBHHK59/15]|nr:hypothetical protein B0H10DRAFT_2208548 [Mycena sp. CBHHK59/15]